jgi:sn-glycerol 3-phosphate transport system substrate-binding protein
MRKMNKFLATAMSVCMCAGLAACGGSSTTATTKAAAATTKAASAAATTKAAAAATTKAAAATTKAASGATTKAASSGSAGKTTIQFWHSMSGANGDALDKMIQTFNSSQDKVEVVGTYQGDYYTSIANAITAIASGNGPDLIQSGSDQVRLLSDEEGIVANMLDYLKPENGVTYDDFYEGFIKSYLSADKKYLSCLPMGCSTPVLYCNSTLLKKAGVEAPKTWDDMQAVCKKLVESGASQYGFAQPRDSWYFWMIIPNYSGQEIFSSDGTKLACREGGIQSFEFLENMVKNNYFYPGPATDSGTNCLQLLQAQKVAFYINSIGGLKGAENAAKEGGWDLDVEAIPAGKVGSVPSGGNSLVMLNSSKHKDAVWSFLKWLYTSEDGIATFDSQSGYFACTKTIKNTKILQKKIADDKNYAKAYDFIGNVNNNHRITGESDLSTDIMNFMDAIFYDKKDVASSWDTMEKAVNDKLKEAHSK